MNHKRIHIDPSWQFKDEQGNCVEPKLFTLLTEVYHHQKLTLAAKSAGISYRHSWNLLNKWADFFGTELVTLEKGRGAKLTLLGEKLLWAQQRVVARLQPQLDNLASELNQEIQNALSNLSQKISIHASHGYAVALLPNACDDLQIDLQYSTPLDALNALIRGHCNLAGLHMPKGITVTRLHKQYRTLLKSNDLSIIRFITRQQGLMVKRGNPLSINGVKDLENKEIRFINRQAESGTRALLDQLLLDQKINPANITGYHNQEFTHSAVAAYIAADMADTGFGVAHAANLFGLDFIPMCEEDYVFVAHSKQIKHSALLAFIEALQSDLLQEKLQTLIGYKADRSGEIVTLDEWLV